MVMALVMTTLIGLTLWGFQSSWQSIGDQLTTLPDSVDVSYGYLLPEAPLAQDVVTKQSFNETGWNQAPLQYSDLDVWLQLNIENTAQQSAHLVLLLDNPMYNRIEVFRLNSDGQLTSMMLSGDTTRSPDKSLLATPKAMLDLAPQQSETLYVHGQTDGAPILPLSLMTTENAQELQRHLHLIWGAFIGVVLLMSSYNLVLFFGLKDTTYLTYIGYVMTMLLLLGVVHGFGYYLFPVPLQQLLARQIISINTVAAFFTFLFAVQFLKYSAEDGRIYQVSQGFLVLLPLFFLVTLIIPEYLAAQMFSLIQVMTCILIVWLIAHRIPDSLKWAKYYIVSWIPLLFGAAVPFLMYSGLLEYSFFNRHAFLYSILFEMALISMALADRFAGLEQDRLYRATHDNTLGLANEALLKEAIDRVAGHRTSDEIALVAVEITNFDAVMPYVREDELSDLIHSLSQRFIEELSAGTRLVDIDHQSTYYKKTALMRGEVLCFLLRTGQSSQVEALMARISNRDNFNPLQDQIPYRIHCRFGVAILTPDVHQTVDLIARVRRALHEAKTSNKPFHIYRSKQDRDRSHHIRLAQDLVNAIESGELMLYHQPQQSLKDPSLMMSEVLLRWQHPQHGMVSPDEIIAIAEGTGLIKSLTRWVLKQAFQQARTLLNNGRPLQNLSINISATDLSRADFAKDVIEELEQWQLNAELFTLEVTESTLLSNQYFFQKNFRDLKARGFHFAIDDFGTGYSSLSYAYEHPFSEMKIDRSFITDLLQDPKRQTIVSATISMAKELKLEVTAEGVEDEATHNLLRQLGCDKLQGFLLSKPMPFDAYLNWQNEPGTSPLQTTDPQPNQP